MPIGSPMLKTKIAKCLMVALLLMGSWLILANPTISVAALTARLWAKVLVVITLGWVGAHWIQFSIVLASILALMMLARIVDDPERLHSLVPPSIRSIAKRRVTH